MGHDEYWTIEMFRNVQAAVRAGTSAAFFSGNTACGRVEFNPSLSAFERVGVFGPPGAPCCPRPSSVIRSPSRSAAAPVDTTWVPSDDPDITSTCATFDMPSVTGWNFATSPSDGR